MEESSQNKSIRDFGYRVFLCEVVEYFKNTGMTYRKSREKVFDMVLSEKTSSEFIGFERTSEIFVSRYKDDTWRDKKSKRNWIMFQDSWISHMNFKKNN